MELEVLSFGPPLNSWNCLVRFRLKINVLLGDSTMTARAPFSWAHTCHPCELLEVRDLHCSVQVPEMSVFN